MIYTFIKLSVWENLAPIKEEFDPIIFTLLRRKRKLSLAIKIVRAVCLPFLFLPKYRSFVVVTAVDFLSMILQ